MSPQDPPLHPPPPRSVWHWCLVISQFVTAALLVCSLQPGKGTPGWWFISGSGIVLGLWAIASMGVTRVNVFPGVRSDSQLVQSGPYRLLRHPMYAALLLFCGGFVLAPYSWWKLLLWGLLLVTLLEKSRIEETLLRARFPEYQEYQRRTWRILPPLW